MMSAHSDPLQYRIRSYRNNVRKGHLTSFRVQLRETDLWISASCDLSDIAKRSVYRYRHFIEEYIRYHPQFYTSFEPIALDPLSPPIIRDMLEATMIAGVGPMASVAGAIAQFVGTDLKEHSKDVIVENGGDVFISASEEILVGIFAGESPLSEKIVIRIRPEITPAGVCTSSGKIGHSISFGKADAVCVISRSATLADAAATAVGNLVKSESDIRMALETGKAIDGVQGVLIIMGERLGILGSVELA